MTGQIEEQKPTPGPWMLGTQINDHGLVIRGEKGSYVARIGENLRERDANAALIVRAVNAHDTLVTALREIERGLANTGSTPDKWMTRMRKPDAFRIARAALAALKLASAS